MLAHDALHSVKMQTPGPECEICRERSRQVYIQFNLERPLFSLNPAQEFFIAHGSYQFQI